MIYSKEMAEAVAVHIQRVTGDQTRIHHYCQGQWRVERYTGSRWVNA